MSESAQTAAGISRKHQNLFFFPPLPTPQSYFPTTAPPRHVLPAGTGLSAGQDGMGGAALAPNRDAVLGVGGKPQGYSHNCRQGAVAGHLIETLHMSDGFLGVLEAAFDGRDVGCEGKGETL